MLERGDDIVDGVRLQVLRLRVFTVSGWSRNGASTRPDRRRDGGAQHGDLFAHRGKLQTRFDGPLTCVQRDRPCVEIEALGGDLQTVLARGQAGELQGTVVSGNAGPPLAGTDVNQNDRRADDGAPSESIARATSEASCAAAAVASASNNPTAALDVMKARTSTPFRLHVWRKPLRRRPYGGRRAETT